MNKISILALLAGVLLVLTPTIIRAQDDAKKADAAAQTSGDKTAPAKSGGPLGSGGDVMGSFLGGGFDFNKIQAANVFMEPDGAVRLVADNVHNVIIDSDQMNLNCREVNFNPDTKIMVATGKPVKVEQQQYKAECQVLTYDVDRKTTKLEGKPFIYQNIDGETTKVTADIITLYQGKDGKMGMTLSNSKESTHPVLIEKNRAKGRSAESGAGATTRTEPQKVKTNNTNIIKMPEIE